MNDTLAIPAPIVSVPPGMRPWWAVRRPLIFALGLLMTLWLALSLQRPRVERWMVTDLPVDDAIVLRLAGYY